MSFFYIVFLHSLRHTAPTFLFKQKQVDALLRASLQRLASALPGVHFYVALLRPGGDCLAFVAATPASRMVGRTLARGAGGVCFDCVGPGYATRGVGLKRARAFAQAVLPSFSSQNQKMFRSITHRHSI